MLTQTTLVTGFLGSGKTTTLRHLLAHKPADENWAILVNEFGDIGVDGALLADSGAQLKEIPGGCMCCVNGLPMQVGLNTLLQRNRPDRLLIEPTGLGHPRQILSMLRAETYRPWLTLQATLCLLDARQLLLPRYRENENFISQLAAADIIIANKQDVYDPSALASLAAWQQQHARGRRVIHATQGDIPLTLLDEPNDNLAELPQAQHHHARPRPGVGLAALTPAGSSGWRRALNEGQGWYACGWVFNADTRFDTVGLLEWMRLAPVERIKGVMRIPEGTVTFNRQNNDLRIETHASPPPDSRVELITSASVDWNQLQSDLLKLRLN